jgi:hypothetical protein
MLSSTSLGKFGDFGLVFFKYFRVFRFGLSQSLSKMVLLSLALLLSVSLLFLSLGFDLFD